MSIIFYLFIVSASFINLTHAAGVNATIQHFVENNHDKFNGVILLSQEQHNSSGGIISTAHDMLRWNECLHNGHILLPDSYNTFISPSVQRIHRWGKIGYGYGVQVANNNGILEISHNGYVPGYCSTLIYYPLQKISLLILENKTLWTKEWKIPNHIRCYATHDAIRKIVREYIADISQEDKYQETDEKLTV